MRYENRTVLVTGAGSGIGRALARGFAAEGATVVVCGRRLDALSETVALVEADGGAAVALPADVTRPEELARLIGEVVDRYGGLDVAVNNAGTLATAPTTELPEEDWARLMDVNATGVFHAMRQEIGAMRARGGGVIVNIGSNIGVHVRLPACGGYAASKAAMTALSRTAALEYIGEGIRINVVSPGPVDTPMSLLPGETSAERTERMREALPLGRVCSLEEVTSTVLWLASDDASFVVGHDLVLDGGASV
jgi:NAD(P)-dependent dehydrogenase (short-subunit alcohol dehydrogenase family)